MTAYTTRSSVNERLPPGAIGSESGLVASSLAGSDTITLDGHGFETGDPMTVRAVDGGSLSAPLASSTTYYAIRLSNAEFKLATSEVNAQAGTAINLTTNAISMVIIVEPDFEYWIDRYSRWADTFFPGHQVPFASATADPPTPGLVEMLVADLVAKRMFNVGGQQSETLKEMELAAGVQLARFAAGLPLRDAAATGSANKAITSSHASTADPRGWAGSSGSGTLP